MLVGMGYTTKILFRPCGQKRFASHRLPNTPLSEDVYNDGNIGQGDGLVKILNFRF